MLEFCKVTIGFDNIAIKQAPVIIAQIWAKDRIRNEAIRKVGLRQATSGQFS